jgi:hypothetical protein
MKNRFPVTGWRRRLAIFANRPAGYGCRFCPKTGNRNRLFSPTQKLKFIGRVKFNHFNNTVTLLITCGLKLHFNR